MKFPVATRTTAFIAGASFAALIVLLENLSDRVYSSQLITVLLAAYFFVSAIIFVVGVRNLWPKELSGIFFPTNRESLRLMLSVMLPVWGRMLIWFLGAVAVGGITAFVQLVGR